MGSFLEKTFKLKDSGTNVRTEIIAGITTFMTMSYILAVNPQILSASGMDINAIFYATVFSSAIGCLIMGFFANYPFALAPGLGLNAFFSYTVCLGMGYSWQLALFAVFIEGIIFIILSLSSVRERIFNEFPVELKKGVSVGIGLFVTFIGLQNAKIIVNSDATLVALLNFKSSFNTVGIGALLAILGLFIILLLDHKKVKGAVFFGIISVWVIGIICEFAGIYVPDPANGVYSLIPSWSGYDLSSIGSTFGKCFDFASMNFKIVDLIIIVFTFLFSDMFDTMGTVIGVATKAKMVDKDGKLPRIKQTFLADAIATSVGAVLGTSTTTTYVESSAGVSAGGRTGLTAVTTGVLFLLSIVLAPVFVAIPSFATASALLYVGFLMISVVTEIKFADVTEGIPAFLCFVSMVLSYSIADGIAIGTIAYVVINLITKNTKKISWMMYILTILFIVKYIFI